LKQGNIIEVKDLDFSWKTEKTLEGISFSVEKGDYVGLVGPNGSGKSTLIKILAGLLVPQAGEVRMDTENFGYLQQKTSLANSGFPATVSEVVQTGLLRGKRYPRVFGPKDKIKTEEALAAMGISALKSRSIGELSGGQLQKALLARALVSHPEVLILDEPTAAFDPESREAFYDLMKKKNSEDGTTIILVTHDIGSIGDYASKILYVDKTLVFFGTFDEFCSSESMTGYFGQASQHLFCHRHDHEDFHV
jgi:zinc transport system ATP-binding protein